MQVDKHYNTLETIQSIKCREIASSSELKYIKKLLNCKILYLVYDIGIQTTRNT